MNRKKAKQMAALAERLNKALNATPYDPDVYNAIVDEINKTHRCLYRGRRIPWLMIGCILFLFLLLAWICYGILPG